MAALTESTKAVLVVYFLCLFVQINHAMMENLYCGIENCYDILDVTRETTRGDIIKVYRKLARKWHPDLHRGLEAKKEAEEMFQKIANAYEVLRDEETRENYNYMLDNPEEYYTHYYYYYRRRVTPKVDVRLVLAATITVISLVQYYSAWNNYNEAIKYFSSVPKYRLRALDIARQEGLIAGGSGAKSNKKKDKGKTKEEMREEEDRVIKQVLEENMDIRGGYQQPTVYDVLWVQLVMLPYTAVKYVQWYATWMYRFDYKGEEYGDEEKLHLIKRHMKYGNSQWAGIDEHEKEDFLHQELWIKENFDEYKQEKDEEQKRKLAESGKHKSYRRYMKNNGPGRMTFED